MRIGRAFPEVLAAAQAGGEWAWRRLFDSVAAGVRGYLAAQGAADPDGLTGDVLLQLVRGLPGFTGDESGFRSWVFLIAHHRLVDERRRGGRAAAVHPAPERGRDEPAAESVAMGRLADGEWHERLASLGDDQRAVLLLRVVAGLSAEEVGRILGKRPGAVRVIQHRALSRLRSLLAEV